MKSYESIDKWDDNYNGAAIYSLVDKTNGKRYIGQAKHLQQRLETHRRELNRIIYNPNCLTAEGIKLKNAVIKGSRFKVEILHKIPELSACVNELRYWESFYHNKFGGYENTYNTAYVIEPEWYCEPYNDVELVIDVDDADIINKLNSVPNKNEYIKGLIRRVKE